MCLDVCEDLARYYRALIPKYWRYNIPRYKPHATIVRGKYEDVSSHEKWGIHEGRQIEFSYRPYVMHDELYIWLRVDCLELEKLRAELGLDRCFDKFKWFHITIGNFKGLYGRS